LKEHLYDIGETFESLSSFYNCKRAIVYRQKEAETAHDILYDPVASMKKKILFLIEGMISPIFGRQPEDIFLTWPLFELN